MLRRLALILGAVLTAVAVAGCAAISALQDEFVYPNAAEGPMARPPPAAAFQHWLTAADGSRVESWLFLPPGASAANPAPAVMFFHGNSDFIENKLEYADFYTGQGMAILLVEYRGYRRSSGKPSETALAQDSDGFFDWLAAQPQIDRARIAAHGHSLGAAVAAGLANRRPIRALVMVSAFKSLPDLFGRYLVPPVLARSRFDNMDAVKRYPGPILLVHGEADEIIPHTHVQALAQQAAGSVTMISYPGVDHDVPWDWSRFGSDLIAFYQRSQVLMPPATLPSGEGHH